MSKSNVSDIDYSAFNEIQPAATAEASAVAKPKSSKIAERSIAKPKSEPKPIVGTDVSNPTAVAERATETSNAFPGLEIPDSLVNYALPALGVLGAGLAGYGLYKSKGNPDWGKSVAGAPPEGMGPKPDLRNIGATPEVAPSAASAPAAQNLPKPTFPQGAIQQPVISGYGQQTMNAPTGVPNVAAPAAPVAPPADVAPQPVDPRQAALIRKAEAEAGIAEHKLQQLQLNAKVTPAGKPAGSVSETDLQMVQKSGEASTDKMLRSQAAATTAVDKIAPAADPIQTTATPAEKQAAVDVVAEENKKAEAKKQAPAIEGKAGAAVEPPEGYIPSYMKGKPKKGGGFEYKNKQGADVIGQGGWHWYQGQMGPEAKAEWEKTYGKTNQSYDTVKADVASGKLKGPEVVEGKGGKFPRQANVPNYIKGSSSLGMAGTLAGLGLLGVAGSEKGREAMSRAASAISDLGVSPDIFAGKGEELGKLGKSYITAGNPNYIREIRAQLEVERDPNRRAILQEELQKAGGSGSSRGIAPPSAYLR